MSAHHAKAIFSADDTSMQAVMDRMERKLKHLEHRFHDFHELAEKALELTGVALLLEQGFEGFFQVLEKGEHLHNLSAMTGAAVGDLFTLEKMFASVGGSAEDAGALIGHMQRTLASGAGSGLLAQLGLDNEALRKTGAVESFRQIGEAIAKLPNAADRAAAATELLGKKGRETLAIFAHGDVDKMFESAQFQAEIYQRNAGTFGEVATKLTGIPDRLRTSWLVLADSMASTLIPLLDEVTAALDKWNRGGTVAAAGSVGGYLISQISDPNGDALGEVFNMLYTGADNFVTRLFGGTDVVDPLGFGERAAAWEKQHAEEQDAAAHHGAHGGEDPLLDFGSGGSALTSLGRVGGAWGSGGADPWLDESRQHTRLLEQIATNTGGPKGHAPAEHGEKHATYTH